MLYYTTILKWQMPTEVRVFCVNKRV